MSNKLGELIQSKIDTIQTMCNNINNASGIRNIHDEIEALQKQLAYVCNLRKQTEELIALVDGEAEAETYKNTLEEKFNSFKILQSSRIEQIKFNSRNDTNTNERNIAKDKEVKKSEFSIGTKILGVIGMLFVIIAAVIFGSMVMVAVSDAVKSLLLMALAICVTMVGYRKTTKDDESIIGKLLLGGGLGLLYLSIYFGYATFEVLSSITMIVMILGLTIVSWGISKLTDSKWVALLTCIGCYLPCLSDVQTGTGGYVIFSIYLIMVGCLTAIMIQGKNWVATAITSSVLSIIANSVFLCISEIPEKMYSLHIILAFMAPVIITYISECSNRNDVIRNCDGKYNVTFANKLFMLIMSTAGAVAMLCAAMDATEFMSDADTKLKAIMYFSGISGIVIVSVVCGVTGLLLSKMCGTKDWCSLMLRTLSVINLSTVLLVVSTPEVFAIALATIALLEARLAKEDNIGLGCEVVSAVSLAIVSMYVVSYLSTSIEHTKFIIDYTPEHWYWCNRDLEYGIAIGTSAIVFVASCILIETSRYRYRSLLPMVAYLSMLAMMYCIVDNVALSIAIENKSGLESSVITTLALTLPAFNIMWILLESGIKSLGEKANRAETKIGFLVTLAASISFQLMSVARVNSEVFSLEVFENLWVLKAIAVIEVVVYTIMLSVAFDKNLRKYSPALRFMLKEVVIFIVGIIQLAIIIGEEMLKLPISCAFILLGIMWIYRGFKSGKSYVRISGLVSIILGVAKSTFIDVLATDNTFLILGFYFFGGLILLGIAAAYNKALKNIENQ